MAGPSTSRSQSGKGSPGLAKDLLSTFPVNPIDPRTLALPTLGHTMAMGTVTAATGDAWRRGMSTGTSAGQQTLMRS